MMCVECSSLRWRLGLEIILDTKQSTQQQQPSHPANAAVTTICALHSHGAVKGRSMPE